MNLYKRYTSKKLSIGIFTCMMLFLIQTTTNAQEMPPRPVSIYFIQNLQFGALYPGASGGLVFISPTGSRSSTGSVVLVNLGFPFSQAIFEIEGERGTVIHILPVMDAPMYGNQGGSMKVAANDFIPGDPIILTQYPPARTQIYMGGYITVGSLLANPVGDYKGTLEVTFVQE